MSVAAGLAEFSHGLRAGDIPDDVVRAACAHVLDGVGCAIAAGRYGTVAPATAVAASFGTGGGPGEARYLGGSEALPAPAAALASGALIHGLDYDDTHPDALVHVTAAVLPAVLAVGEEVRASGEAALEALIVGYEAVIRLGAAVPHGFHARGLHATSVCGVLASALAASRLYGLDVARTVDALGIAGSEAGGLLEFLHTGSSTKQLHPGLAGMGGVLAARLAGAGASGPASVIEGEYGLFAALAGCRVEPVVVLGGLGSRFETERIALKPYPACQLLHAALDACQPLAAAVRANGGAAAVREVVVTLPAESVPIVAEPAADKQAPGSEYEGKFSLPFSVAAMLVDGSVGLETYRATSRADVLGLAALVRYEVQPFAGPPAAAPSTVSVVVGSKRLDSRAVARPVSLAPDERIALVRAKFLDNCVRHPRAPQLAEAVLGLAEACSLTRLLDLAAEVAGASGSTADGASRHEATEREGAA